MTVCAPARPLLLLSLVALQLPLVRGACRASSATGAAERATPCYTGVECMHDGFAAAGCPVRGMCGHGTTDRCTVWRSGVFVTPPGWPPDGLPYDVCASTDADGAFADGVWTPADVRCRLHCFTPWQAARLLAGRRVLFAGDSMMRQLFMHFVAFLRALDVVEQTFRFHHGAFYQRSAEADLLCVQDGCLNETLTGASTRLRFVWSPRHVPGDVVRQPVDQDNTPHSYSGHLLADAAVVGIIFHRPSSDTLLGHLAALSAMARTTPVMWITTPGADYAARNEALRAWVARTANASVLCLDRLAADGAYRSVDGLHFACNVDVHKDARHQKACRDAFDTVNGNLMQMVLNKLAATWG